MRRLLRPIVIAIATLGLALGAGVGLAAPALADSGFTAAVAGAPLTEGVSEIDFSGTKPSGSAITSTSVNISGPAPICGGTAAGGANWTCEFNATDPVGAGHYSAQIVLVNADNTLTTQVLSLVVYAATEPAPPPSTPTSPLVGYQFTPGGVSVTTTATGGAPAASVVITGQGEGNFDVNSCPAGTNSDFPLGTNPAPSVTCANIDPLYDGTSYVAQSVQGNPGAVSPDQSNGVFYLPSNQVNLDGAPLALSANHVTRTVTVSGSLRSPQFSYGDAIVLLDSNGGILCRTKTPILTNVYLPAVDANVDTWSCTTNTLSFGPHALTVAVEDDGNYTGEGELYALSTVSAPYGYYVLGGLSSSTTVGTVTFTAPPSPVGGTTRGDITPNWSFSVTGDLTNVHPGDILTIAGTGLPAGTKLDSILHSVPTDLGTVVAAADGTFNQTVTVPADVELGAHTIEVTATGPGLVKTSKQQALTVTAPASTSSGGGTGSVKKTPTGVHSAGGSESAKGIAPNILTQALTPFADVAVHPNKIISAFEIGLVLLLLAVLPAHLLNATIAEQSDRFERRFGKARMPNWLFRLGIWFRSAPVAGGIVVTLVTAVLFGFADPKFGFTLASLRLILACGIALFLVGYVANALTGLIARVQWNVLAAVSTRPYGLVLTIVGVLVSRVLHFSPGFLIGLILGLTIQERSASQYAWRTIVLRSSIVLAMAVAAWIGYSTLTLSGTEGGTFGSALAVETLVAITTEGVVALLVELLPLKFLEGQRIYDHSRALWAVFYFLTLVVFVLAVVPWEGNWDALHGSLWVWIVVLAAFATICVGIYVYFRNFSPPEEAEDEDEEVPLGETVARDRAR